MFVLRILVLSCVALFPAWGALAEDAGTDDDPGQSALSGAVVRDGGVGISYGELEFIISQWPPHMQQAAADDTGDRFELLNTVMVSAKLARDADTFERSAEASYQYKLKIESEKRKYLLQEVVRTLEVPDMTELARERYETEKDKYALIPETRMSSHILISCPTGSKCSRPEAEETAQELLEQLRAGADFEEMVQLHSADESTKAKGGKFDRWISMGDKGISPPYVVGTFKISKVGEYSEIVNSQFGIHVIRLDGVREKSYAPFHKVQARIIADLETEYRKLALKEFRARYNLSEDAFIDGDAVDKIFSKYKAAN